MGLIAAAITSASKALGDQFKEYVTCPSMDKNVLIQRGEVHHGSGNFNPSEGVISNGSAIVVPQGMAMMIVDNGEIKEFTTEPGTYTWNTSSEPSIFTGGLWNGVKDTIKTIGKRITYGGQPAKDQRVYYVNLLVISGNKFGSPQPKKITDEKYGMLEVTFFGEFAFQVKDPVILVQNVIGANAKDTITYDEVVGSQLKSKFIEKITQAIAAVMRKQKVSFGDMGLYGSDISDEMNTILDESWHQSYGLEITDVALADVNLTEESMKRVSNIDDAAIFSNKDLQSGLMAHATAEAMKNAASNGNGSMAGFMGMNMAGMMGANAMGVVNQSNQVSSQNVSSNSQNSGSTVSDGTMEGEVHSENSSFGSANFCSNCGAKVTGKFCSNCGAKIEN